MFTCRRDRGVFSRKIHYLGALPSTSRVEREMIRISRTCSKQNPKMYICNDKRGTLTRQVEILCEKSLFWVPDVTGPWHLPHGKVCEGTIPGNTDATNPVKGIGQTPLFNNGENLYTLPALWDSNLLTSYGCPSLARHNQDLYQLLLLGPKHLKIIFYNNFLNLFLIFFKPCLLIPSIFSQVK